MINKHFKADVEAIIENKRDNKYNPFQHPNPFGQGYSPAHLVRPDYLTSGRHHYLDKDEVYFNETATAEIQFLSPETYPKCLWVGKKIQFQEGSRITGYATITKIYNKIVESDSNNV